MTSQGKFYYKLGKVLENVVYNTTRSCEREKEPFSLVRGNLHGWIQHTTIYYYLITYQKIYRELYYLLSLWTTFLTLQKFMITNLQTMKSNFSSDAYLFYFLLLYYAVLILPSSFILIYGTSHHPHETTISERNSTSRVLSTSSPYETLIS